MLAFVRSAAFGVHVTVLGELSDAEFDVFLGRVLQLVTRAVLKEAFFFTCWPPGVNLDHKHMKRIMKLEACLAPVIVNEYHAVWFTIAPWLLEAPQDYEANIVTLGEEKTMAQSRFQRSRPWQWCQGRHRSQRSDRLFRE